MVATTFNYPYRSLYDVRCASGVYTDENKHVEIQIRQLIFRDLQASQIIPLIITSADF